MNSEKVMVDCERMNISFLSMMGDHGMELPFFQKCDLKPRFVCVKLFQTKMNGFVHSTGECT